MAAKNAGGGVVAVAVVVVVVFRSLITERSGRPRNAACPAEGSTSECDGGRNPAEYSECLTSWVFPRQATRVSYAVHRMCSYAFVYFSKKITGHWKRTIQTTKEQRTVQTACTTTGTERRAHRTAHFVAARNPAACIYFSAFRRMRLTHNALVRKAHVKKWTMVTARKN